MYAVLKTGGKQYRVEKEDVVLVEKLDANDGDQVVLDNILMIGEGKKVTLGSPLVNDAAVMAQVIRQTRGPKITMIYKRRRKNSRRKQGHKQNLTLLKIIDIAETGGSGYFLIGSEVGSEHLKATLIEINKEMNLLQSEKISQEELQLVKNHLLGQLLKMSDGPYAMMDLFLSVESYQMTSDFYNAYIQRIHDVNPEVLIEIAQKYLNWDEMSVISAG